MYDYFEKAGTSIEVEDEDWMNRDKPKMTECTILKGDTTWSLSGRSIPSSCTRLILQEFAIVKFV